jgi:hypothetical protein
METPESVEIKQEREGDKRLTRNKVTNGILSNAGMWTFLKRNRK